MGAYTSTADTDDFSAAIRGLFTLRSIVDVDHQQQIATFDRRDPVDGGARYGSTGHRDRGLHFHRLDDGDGIARGHRIASKGLVEPIDTLSRAVQSLTPTAFTDQAIHTTWRLGMHRR
jgi:hypothetical protein